MGYGISKYRAKKAEYDGHRFDSIHEMQRYKELKQMQEEHIISDLKLQVPYVLAESQDLPNPFIQKCKSGKTRVISKYSPVKYVADFTYRDANGCLVVEDAKGVKTDSYQIKKKWLMQRYGIQIREV